MEPIVCTYLTTTKQNLCWISTGSDSLESDSQGYGYPFVFFPLIQHWDNNCNKCEKIHASTKYCNTVDMMYLLFFDEEEWSSHHYVKSAGIYGAPDYTWFKDQSLPSPLTDDSHTYWSRGGGNTGVIVINNYGGVKYLNEYRYPMPKHPHCTTNVLALPQVKGSMKAAALKNLEAPPSKLQELYYKCHYTPDQCISQGIAAGSGYSSLASTVLMVCFGFIAVKMFGIPKGGVDDAHLRINDTESDIAELRAHLGLKSKTVTLDTEVEMANMKQGSKI
jgi:hypothetical protein